MGSHVDTRENKGCFVFKKRVVISENSPLSFSGYFFCREDRFGKEIVF